MQGITMKELAKQVGKAHGTVKAYYYRKRAQMTEGVDFYKVQRGICITYLTPDGVRKLFPDTVPEKLMGHPAITNRYNLRMTAC